MSRAKKSTIPAPTQDVAADIASFQRSAEEAISAFEKQGNHPDCVHIEYVGYETALCEVVDSLAKKRSSFSTIWRHSMEHIIAQWLGTKHIETTCLTAHADKEAFENNLIFYRDFVEQAENALAEFRVRYAESQNTPAFIHHEEIGNSGLVLFTLLPKKRLDNSPLVSFNVQLCNDNPNIPNREQRKSFLKNMRKIQAWIEAHKLHRKKNIPEVELLDTTVDSSASPLKPSGVTTRNTRPAGVGLHTADVPFDDTQAERLQKEMKEKLNDFMEKHELQGDENLNCCARINKADRRLSVIFYLPNGDIKRFCFYTESKAFIAPAQIMLGDLISSMQIPLVTTQQQAWKTMSDLSRLAVESPYYRFTKKITADLGEEYENKWEERDLFFLERLYETYRQITKDNCWFENEAQYQQAYKKVKKYLNNLDQEIAFEDDEPRISRIYQPINTGRPRGYLDRRIWANERGNLTDIWDAIVDRQNEGNVGR